MLLQVAKFPVPDNAYHRLKNLATVGGMAGREMTR